MGAMLAGQRHRHRRGASRRSVRCAFAPDNPQINGSIFTSQGSSDTARSARTVARQSYYAVGDEHRLLPPNTEGLSAATNRRPTRCGNSHVASTPPPKVIRRKTMNEEEMLEAVRDKWPTQQHRDFLAQKYCCTPLYIYHILTGNKRIPRWMLAELGYEKTRVVRYVKRTGK